MWEFDRTGMGMMKADCGHAHRKVGAGETASSVVR